MDNLIQAAKNIIDQRYKKDIFQTGAAIRTSSGKIYTGVAIKSQSVSLCSEWTPIGKAFSEGDYDIESAVAVKKHEDGRYEILPPCALCRELYITYCPNAIIIIGEGQEIKASELLPNAWKKKSLSKIDLN